MGGASQCGKRRRNVMFVSWNKYLHLYHHHQQDRRAAGLMTSRRRSGLRNRLHVPVLLQLLLLLLLSITCCGVEQVDFQWLSRHPGHLPQEQKGLLQLRLLCDPGVMSDSAAVRQTQTSGHIWKQQPPSTRAHGINCPNNFIIWSFKQTRTCPQ